MKTTETLKFPRSLYRDDRVNHLFRHDSTDDGGADDAASEVAEPTDVKFVGAATAPLVEAAEFTARDVAERRVSYRMLVDAGVNPGVAAKIRRHLSLSWSFESGDDLSRRSEQIRGLREEERAWVASSYGDGDGDDTSDAGDEADAETASTSEDEWVAAAGARETAGDAGRDVGPRQDASDQFTAEASWVAQSALGDGAETASADGSGDPVAAEAAWRERSKPTPITAVSGVGEARAERLAEAGVTSVRSLATADPELLAEVTGLPVASVRKWHVAASEMAD